MGKFVGKNSRVASDFELGKVRKLGYCGNPTFRTNSANRGSERMGSSEKSVFKIGQNCGGHSGRKSVRLFECNAANLFGKYTKAENSPA